MELHWSNVECAIDLSPVGKLVWLWDEDRIRITGETGEDVCTKVLISCQSWRKPEILVRKLQRTLTGQMK